MLRPNCILNAVKELRVRDLKWRGLSNNPYGGILKLSILELRTVLKNQILANTCLSRIDYIAIESIIFQPNPIFSEFTQ